MIAYLQQLNGTTMVLIAALLAIVGVLVRLHLSQTRTDFDLTDLLMAGGKVDPVRCVAVGSFFVTSWVILAMSIKGQLPFEHFSAYLAAWVAPVVTNLIWGNKTPPSAKP